MSLAGILWEVIAEGLAWREQLREILAEACERRARDRQQVRDQPLAQGVSGVHLLARWRRVTLRLLLLRRLRGQWSDLGRLLQEYAQQRRRAVRDRRA